jgi:hypothetical protein
MTEVTTNGIVKWTNSDPSSIVQESQAQGDSIELALSKRERYDFVWENSAERTAQTGMVQGSRGYQVDTKTEYAYDSSNWRLALPYAEFNSSANASPNANVLSIGTMTVNPTTSTSTTMAVAVPARPGNLTLVDSGIYSITATSFYGGTINGRTFLAVNEYVSTVPIVRFGATTGETLSSIAAVYRTSSSNFEISFQFFKNTTVGSTDVNTTVRIARLG